MTHEKRCPHGLPYSHETWDAKRTPPVQWCVRGRSVVTPPAQDEPLIGIVRAVLAEHWLFDIGCDHEAETNSPVCACCLVNLGTHSTVGGARDAWIAHVTEQIKEASRVPAAPSVSTDHTDEKPGQQQAINVALTAFYASPANEHTRHAVRAAVEAAYPVIARAVLQDFLDNYTKGLAGRG